MVWLPIKVGIAHFIFFLILKYKQSLTPFFYTTKEYSDITLYIGGKIRS